MNTLDTLAHRYVKTYCKRKGIVYKELNTAEKLELWTLAKDSIEPMLLEYYVAKDLGDKPAMIKKWGEIMRVFITLARDTELVRKAA